MKVKCVLNTYDPQLLIGNIYKVLDQNFYSYLIFDGDKKIWVLKECFTVIEENNLIEKPNHYTTGGIETIDFIKAKLEDGIVDFCIGNVIKYVSRYKHKNGLEDLKKAQKYIEWAIEEYKS